MLQAVVKCPACSIIVAIVDDKIISHNSCTASGRDISLAVSSDTIRRHRIFNQRKLTGVRNMPTPFHPVAPIFKEDELDENEFHQLLVTHWSIDLSDTHKLIESVASIKSFIRKSFVSKNKLRRLIDHVDA